MNWKKLLLGIAVVHARQLCAQSVSNSTLNVSSLFTDHMVIQQKDKASFWGKSSPRERVRVTASWGRSAFGTADSYGNWKLKLPTPGAGGPYEVTISAGKKSLSIKDVLVGEVWLASGQSNMDISLSGWPPGDTIKDSALEIGKADIPEVRFFKVPFAISVKPQEMVVGKWQVCSPKTAGSFSATAYFFAQKLHNTLHVPIGIVQSSIGGTPAEAWTSKVGLAKRGDFNEVIDNLDSISQKQVAWFSNKPQLQTPVTPQEWKVINFDDDAARKQNFDDTNWQTIKVPGKLDQLSSGEVDGAVWLRKTFVIDDPDAEYTINIGSVDDMDADYVNGYYVGGLNGDGFAHTARTFKIPASVLKKGENTLAVRVIDKGGAGDITGPVTITNNKGAVISLEGSWKFKWVAELWNGRWYSYGLNTVTAKRPNLNALNSNTPTVLFNAMINPLIPYTFKGIIWYQGESNVGRAEQYKHLFPLMIGDWRQHWGKTLPFYYVQIAPYLYTAANQKEQSPKLRDAQRYGLLLPLTGMVTTLDIGYLKTAHPPHKREVGYRLAAFALTDLYGDKLIASGPMYLKTQITGNKLTVLFNKTGSGLTLTDDGTSNFEIAGADKKFLPARAVIKSKSVIVQNPAVAAPKFVRYAWRDSSKATLFNKEGLPASTFTSEP